MTPNTYIQLMKEIKHRTQFISELENEPGRALYNWTWIESICLQVRMILENIALACLVANGDQLNKLPNKIEKEYHAEMILRRLDTINPDCYPQPVILVPNPRGLDISNAALPIGQEQYVGDLVARPGDDWLTRDEFKEVYGRIGQVLHARNPIGGKIDFDYYNEMAPKWRDKTLNLLSHHKITVVNDKMMYVVLMQAVGGEDWGHTSGDVQVAEFQKID